MGILQKKHRTTGRKALAYRGKGGQNTDTAFLALRLGVVLYLPTKIEKIQDRSLGLKFSSEIENFKRATHQTPIFCGDF